MATLILCCLTLAFSNFAVADEQQFTQGLRHYSQSQWQEASVSFLAAAKENVDRVQKSNAYYNLGLAEFQKKTSTSNGIALAYLRSAIELNQDLQPARQAKNFVLSQIANGKDLEPEEGFWAPLHKNYLSWFSLAELGVFTWGFFSLGLWLLFVHLKNKNSSPSIALILSSALAVLFGIVLGLKIYDLSIERGTVIGDKVSLLLLPQEGGGGQGEISNGSLVTIVNKSSGWLQIRFGLSQLGWVPEKEIIIHPTSLH